jgi:hypothetical protein
LVCTPTSITPSLRTEYMLVPGIDSEGKSQFGSSVGRAPGAAAVGRGPHPRPGGGCEQRRNAAAHDQRVAAGEVQRAQGPDQSAAAPPGKVLLLADRHVEDRHDRARVPGRPPSAERITTISPMLRVQMVWSTSAGWP